MGLDAIEPGHLEQLTQDFWQEREFEGRSAGLLAEITCSDHEYAGRIGQVLAAQHDTFVASQPAWRAGAMEAALTGERKFALLLKISLALISVPEGCYRLIEKGEIGKDKGIEVVDNEGRVGRILDWKPSERRDPGVLGTYKAQFGEEVIGKDDNLMMQEPTWQFRRRVVEE